jgi:hypothetical protein
MHRNLRRETRELKRGDGHFAQQDDQEPTTADDVRLAQVVEEQDAAVAFDLARNVNKGPRLAALNDAHALDLQVQFQGFIGGGL